MPWRQALVVGGRAARPAGGAPPLVAARRRASRTSAPWSLHPTRPLAQRLTPPHRAAPSTGITNLSTVPLLYYVHLIVRPNEDARKDRTDNK